MWYSLARFILANKLSLIIIIGFITTLMFMQALRVEMDFNLPRIIPSDNPVVTEFKTFQEQFGDDANVLLIGLETKALFEKEFFNAYYQLGKNLEALQSVNTVISVPNISILQKNATEKKFEVLPFVKGKIESQAVLDSMKRLYNSQPFYKDKFWNEASGATIMAITIDSEIMNSDMRSENMEKIVAVAGQFAESTNTKIHYSGLPHLRNFRVTTISDELQLFLLVALVVMSLILLLLFRSFTGLILPVIVVLIGVIWTLGTTVLFGYKITLLIGLVPSLIVIIGIPNCVYLINKYHLEYKKHGDKSRALHKAIERIGNVTFYANLTTAIGFGVFAITKSDLLRQFGVVAGINVLGVFLVSLIVLPTALSYLPPPKKRMMMHLETKIFNRIIYFLKRIAAGKQMPTLIIAGILLIASIFGIGRLESKGFIFDDIPKKSESYKALQFLENNFVGVVPLDIVIEMPKKNDITKNSNLLKLDKLQKSITEDKDIGIPISIVEGMKLATQAYFGGSEKKYALPNSLERNFVLSYMAKMERNNTTDILDAYTDENRQKARLSFLMKDFGSDVFPHKMDTIKSKVEKIFNPEKYKISYTGSGVVSLEGYNYLVKGLINSLLVAFVLIAIIISSLFKSVRMLLVAFVPNIIPLLITAALMGYFDIFLKPSTVLIFSVAFGISVDFTIHFLAKYRLELSRHNWDVQKTVLVALQETGYSMLYTALILLAGFSVFMISSFEGTIYLGLLTCVTLVTSLLANLILLPGILLSIKPSTEIQKMQAKIKANQKLNRGKYDEI